jgi:hypothetical protein
MKQTASGEELSERSPLDDQPPLPSRCRRYAGKLLTG